MSGIVRVKKKRHAYVTIDKTPLLDERLGWKSRGIMAYLLTKPDDWEVSVKNLVNASPDGKECVQSGLKELEACGYITRFRLKDEQGKFVGWETLVFETPEDYMDWEKNRQSGFPSSEKPTTGFPDDGKTDLRENRFSENPPLLINEEELINENELINDLTNTPLTPQGEERVEEEVESSTELNNPELPEPNLEPTASLQKREDLLKTAEPPHQDRSSAASLNSAKAMKEKVLPTTNPESCNSSALLNNSTRRYEDRMRNGGKILNYRTGYGPNDIKQGFITWFCMRVMSDWSQYENKTPQPANAKNWICNKEKERQHDLVEEYYQQMLIEESEPGKAEILRTQNIFRSLNKDKERKRKVEVGVDILDGLGET